MYITYETRQCIKKFRLCGPFLRPIIHTRTGHPCAGSLDPPEFRPTWLIRISDMKLVRGSEVHETYCALSYSWNQSGDISVPEDSQKSTRTDNGKHKIIYYRKKKIRRKTRGRRTILLSKTRSVKFEDVIRRICRDFKIQYLWYDQLCIDQNNPEEKRREIQQMHKIYKNAQCTVVLVPEFYTGLNLRGQRYATVLEIARSEWSKRMWTLEETFMSNRLLFVGSNVHMWSYAFDVNGGAESYVRRGVNESRARFLFDACTRPTKSIASSMLRYASQRTSTKQHDRIFVLANLFPECTKGLSFDHKDPLFSTMLHFYSNLARNDLSILCFGVPDTKIFRLPEENDLPSWTGTKGFHAELNAKTDDPNASVTTWTINGRSLRLKCSYIPISIGQQVYRRHRKTIHEKDSTGRWIIQDTNTSDHSSFLFFHTKGSKFVLNDDRKSAYCRLICHSDLLPAFKNNDEWRRL